MFTQKFQSNRSIDRLKSANEDPSILSVQRERDQVGVRESGVDRPVRVCAQLHLGRDGRTGGAGEQAVTHRISAADTVVEFLLYYCS